MNPDLLSRHPYDELSTDFDIHQNSEHMNFWKNICPYITGICPIACSSLANCASSANCGSSCSGGSSPVCWGVVGGWGTERVVGVTGGVFFVFGTCSVVDGLFWRPVSMTTWVCPFAFLISATCIWPPVSIISGRLPDFLDWTMMLRPGSNLRWNEPLLPAFWDGELLEAVDALLMKLENELESCDSCRFPPRNWDRSKRFVDPRRSRGMSIPKMADMRIALLRLLMLSTWLCDVVRCLCLDVRRGDICVEIIRDVDSGRTRWRRKLARCVN